MAQLTAEQWAEKILPNYVYGPLSDATPQPIRDAIELANSGRAAELLRVASTIREAVLAERAACARVAKDFPVMDFPADRRGSCRQVRHGIAEAIQGRPAP